MRSSILTAKRAKALRRDMTGPEVMLWARLRVRSPDQPVFRRQHPMGPYILDFYCPAAKLAIEIDGSTHGEEDQMAHDVRRDDWLAGQGVTVYRTSASSVFRDAVQVADAVRNHAQERLASPAPSTPRSSAGGPPPPLRGGGKE